MRNHQCSASRSCCFCSGDDAGFDAYSRPLLKNRGQQTSSSSIKRLQSRPKASRLCSPTFGMRQFKPPSVLKLRDTTSASGSAVIGQPTARWRRVLPLSGCSAVSRPPTSSRFREIAVHLGARAHKDDFGWRAIEARTRFPHAKFGHFSLPQQFFALRAPSTVAESGRRARGAAKIGIFPRPRPHSSRVRRAGSSTVFVQLARCARLVATKFARVA